MAGEVAQGRRSSGRDAEGGSVAARLLEDVEQHVRVIISVRVR